MSCIAIYREMFLKIDPPKNRFGIAVSLNRRGIKRGRNPMSKSAQICTRVTPEVMTSLRALADRQSILLSEFIRQTLAEKVSGLTASNEGGLLHRETGVVPFQYRYR
jgi:hypothetical protein